MMAVRQTFKKYLKIEKLQAVSQNNIFYRLTFWVDWGRVLRWALGTSGSVIISPIPPRTYPLFPLFFWFFPDFFDFSDFPRFFLIFLDFFTSFYGFLRICMGFSWFIRDFNCFFNVFLQNLHIFRRKSSFFAVWVEQFVLGVIVHPLISPIPWILW